MSFEKKLMIVKIILFGAIIGVSAYLWFFASSKEEYIYLDGAVVFDEDKLDTVTREYNLLFEEYVEMSSDGESFISYIDSDGNENHYGAIYTDLLIYYSNQSYKVYLMTENLIGHLNNCYDEKSYCLYESDQYLAIRNEEIIDVTSQMKTYYENILDE